MDKFEAVRQLVYLCEANGYDPEGATFEKLWKYTTKTCSPDRDEEPMWCMAWNEMYDYEDYGPQSDGDRPAILFITGRQEWHNKGRLSRLTGPAVITEDGLHQYFFDGAFTEVSPVITSNDNDSAILTKLSLAFNNNYSNYLSNNSSQRLRKEGRHIIQLACDIINRHPEGLCGLEDFRQKVLGLWQTYYPKQEKREELLSPAQQKWIETGSFKTMSFHEYQLR